MIDHVRTRSAGFYDQRRRDPHPLDQAQGLGLGAGLVDDQVAGQLALPFGEVGREGRSEIWFDDGLVDFDRAESNSLTGRPLYRKEGQVDHQAGLGDSQLQLHPPL